MLNKQIIFTFLILLYHTQACSSHCQICQSTVICNRCADGFYLYLNKTCQICQFCDCINPLICSNCSNGYYWSDQQKDCLIKGLYKSSNSVSTQTIIAYVVGCLLTLSCLTIFGLWCLKRLFRNQLRVYQLQHRGQNNRQGSHGNIGLNNTLVFLQGGELQNNNNIINTQNEILGSDQIQIQFKQLKDNCAICLQSDCNIITNCDHYFHLICLQNWIKRNVNCPLCKNSNIKSIKYIICMKCKSLARKIPLFLTKPKFTCSKNHKQNQQITIQTIQ